MVLETFLESPTSRWDGGEPSDPVAALLHASRLLGADRRIANEGGGNTSVKTVASDHTGANRPTLWVKGTGSDLATLGPEHLTALRLDEIEPLFARDSMTDEQMVAHLARCMLDPAHPRGSIETLLHAFVPAPHVHHTHPDAINALACAADGERLVAECFGDTAAWVPYVRPGFSLARQVGAQVRDNPTLELVVLAKHGLVCWGETARDAYERTLAAIGRAAAFVNRRAAGVRRFGGPAAVTPLDGAARRALLAGLLPALRGALSSHRHKLLVHDSSRRVLELVGSERGRELAAVGAACPDHLVHTKRVPLWIPFDPARDDAGALAERVRERAAAYREEDRAYVRDEGGPEPADPDGRVVLVEGLGLVAAGTSLRAARLARDLYLRAIEVMAAADALGGFVSLDAAESYAVEYWPLELYKLSLAPAPGELQGQVALVTGAGGGIGSAIAERLAAAGAAVVGFELDGERAAERLAPLGDQGLVHAGDVTSPDDVTAAFAAAIDAYGGVDIVVSNAGIASSAPIEETSVAEWERNHAVLGTGYFLVAREAFRVMRAQGRGGSIVFIASKNALVAGRNAAAYSSAKAAELHLARCLAEEGGPAGIRVNTVNPDAVLEGSSIWSTAWREERAAAYAIAPDELEEHYRARTVLGVDVRPADVAEAVAHFASAQRSGRSTGNVLNVDGGVTAAYPR